MHKKNYRATTLDTVGVRVQYRALYKHTQEQKEAYDDINLLDIGGHSSRFYSQRFEQFLHLRDSVKSEYRPHKLFAVSGKYVWL